MGGKITKNRRLPYDGKAKLTGDQFSDTVKVGQSREQDSKGNGSAEGRELMENIWKRPRKGIRSSWGRGRWDL